VGPYSVTLNTTTGQAQTEDIADDAVTDDQIASGTTVETVVQGLRGYIDGFVLSRTSATVLGVTAGFASTSVNGSYAINNGADAITLSTSGVGGLGVALASSTWYHVFAIVTTGGATRVYADTSVTAANIPSGYTAYRRVGSFLTNGSSQITNFFQNGDEFLWSTPPALDYDAAPGATTAASVTLSVPIGVKVEAILNVAVFAGGSSVAVYLSSLDTDDVQAALSPGTTDSPLATVYNNGGDHATDGCQARVRTDTSAAIRRRQTTAAATLAIQALGWIDPRGRNA